MPQAQASGPGMLVLHLELRLDRPFLVKFCYMGEVEDLAMTLQLSHGSLLLLFTICSGLGKGFLFH